MKRRGITLVELLVAMSSMSIIIFGTATLFANGLRQFYFADADVEVSQRNAQGIRRVSEAIREAMSITISSDGKTLHYELPARANTPDEVTNELELLDPLQSDGVDRSFTVSGDQLIDDSTDKVLVKNIIDIDPDPDSSQYNQTYAPFQVTTIGSRRAVTINLITRRDVAGDKRWARMKTTVIIRNGQ